MCNARPVLRVGHSLDISLEYRQANGETHTQTWLNIDDAPDIAYWAEDNADAITNNIAHAISKSPDQPKQNVSNPLGKARFSNDRGLILDLPNMIFDTPKYRHRVGLSLTVCMPNTRSKLWFRSQCIGIRHGEDFEPAVELSFQRLEQFFEEASRIAEPAIQSLRAEYIGAVQATLGPRNKDLKIDLKPAKEFRFKVFDSNGNDLSTGSKLEDFFQALEGGASFTGHLKNYIQTNTTPEHPALIATRLNNLEQFEGADVISELEKHRGDIKIFGHQNRDDQSGVFISRKENPSALLTQTFSGVTLDPNANRPERDLAHAPAVCLTAEILAGIVRQYDLDLSTPAR